MVNIYQIKHLTPKDRIDFFRAAGFANFAMKYLEEVSGTPILFGGFSSQGIRADLKRAEAANAPHLIYRHAFGAHSALARTESTLWEELFPFPLNLCSAQLGKTIFAQPEFFAHEIRECSESFQRLENELAKNEISGLSFGVGQAPPFRILTHYIRGRCQTAGRDESKELEPLFQLLDSGGLTEEKISSEFKCQAGLYRIRIEAGQNPFQSLTRAIQSCLDQYQFRVFRLTSSLPLDPSAPFLS